uniref:Uncharacterized protein n=1 Tax=Anguilla anguilla TaxID=7936 RepID=A0A0E9QN60_ANGAN
MCSAPQSLGKEQHLNANIPDYKGVHSLQPTAVVTVSAKWHHSKKQWFLLSS